MSRSETALVDHTVTLERLRTMTESNAKEHWRTKYRRAKEQRSLTFRLLQHCLGVQCPVRVPVTITLTRIAPGTLDDDNLTSALKHVQDGCADYLAGQYGAGQDRQAGLIWQYRQQRGQAHVYAVHIAFAETSQ